MTAKKTQLKMPIRETIQKHYKLLFLGSLSAMSCFTLFFLTSVFSISYATTVHPWQLESLYPQITYLFMLMLAIVFMALGSPVSAWLADRFGRRPTFFIGGIATIIIGYFFGDLMNSTHAWITFLFLSVSLFIMGILWTPLAAFLPEIFPTNVRYTGASLAFSFGGILGGSLTPFAAAWLVTHFAQKGIDYVGWFLMASCVISLIAVWFLPETRHQHIDS